MKNIQDVLHEKEAEIEKLNREIKLLRVAARMLEDDSQSQSTRAVAATPHHADVAAVGPEEPVLEVLPAAPSNGDVSKRWP